MPQRTYDQRRALLVITGTVLVLAGLMMLGAQTVPAPAQPPDKPSAANKCPVCGMFVAGFPDFLAAVVFKDGAVAYFDGCKDMFRFLFDVGRYAPGRARADVASVWATDYYSLRWIDGSAAFFVRGSDILGPMGRELIPLGKESEAKEFMKDHGGAAVLRFAEITPDVLKDVD